MIEKPSGEVYEQMYLRMLDENKSLRENNLELREELELVNLSNYYLKEELRRCIAQRQIVSVVTMSIPCPVCGGTEYQCFDCLESRDEI